MLRVGCSPGGQDHDDCGFATVRAYAIVRQERTEHGDRVRRAEFLGRSGVFVLWGEEGGAQDIDSRLQSDGMIV